jgi:hypothetical protein
MFDLVFGAPSFWADGSVWVGATISLELFDFVRVFVTPFAAAELPDATAADAAFSGAASALLSAAVTIVGVASVATNANRKAGRARLFMGSLAKLVDQVLRLRR